MSLTSEESALISALNDYKAQMRNVHPQHAYFQVMHDQFYQMLQEVFKRLIYNGDLESREEFLHHVELFKLDMIRKYQTTNIYDSRPRSHNQKLKGIPHEDDKPTALLELKRKLESDLSDFSF
ncbi:hypothetical protein VXK10_004107 [Vibrio parahaemolyticus]|nr:hypothetical protein [Vibrio parahaemolyticus]EKL0190346.1 hypothetical protein [Vibrio parahaemolyticus]EME0149549.1 hypothetical protein [Vibrio parahaemolyticus]EME0863104.1 hypothetical protein [Vibrio parahaemolyticus]